jgi:hypothetical protein
MDVTAIQDFQDAYERLSREGKCNGPGSWEHIRVLKEWFDLGQPKPIDDFIFYHANIRSDVTEPTAQD